VESPPSGAAGPSQDEPTGSTLGARSVVDRRLSTVLIFLLDTLMKAAFISFWHIIFSVIRLQAGF
jgi:hypothetical protein